MWTKEDLYVNKSISELWKDILQLAGEYNSMPMVQSLSTCQVTRRKLCIKSLTLNGKVVKLTMREADVMRLLARCLTNQEMAQELKVSVRTIEYFMKGLRIKLGCRSKGGLIKAILDNDLINQL